MKEDIELLFKKFSHPILKSAITSHQIKTGLGISKHLWLVFINEMDSEKNIYNILDKI